MTKIIESVRAKLAGEWIPTLYQELVRSGRTRSFRLEVSPKENHPEILYTLLGIELKVGNRRIPIPDLSTARYLTVFARIGCSEIAIPYDITKISFVANELETAWHHSILLLEKETSGLADTGKSRARSALIRLIRDEIDAIGPGEMMPAFDRPTRRPKA